MARIFGHKKLDAPYFDCPKKLLAPYTKFWAPFPIIFGHSLTVCTEKKNNNKPAWLSEARRVTIRKKKVKKNILFCDRTAAAQTNVDDRGFSPQK